MSDFVKMFMELCGKRGSWLGACGHGIVWIVVAAVVWMAAACGGGGTAGDTRLLAVDSIVDNDSVAAWRQLQAIDSASLTTDADRHLYALLHQQILYKQYQQLDTVVLSELCDYYAAHPDGNRLTRALLLSGGAREDAGLLAEAIPWYKRAEAGATECRDTFLLAFSKMRMAKVYFAAYTQDSIHIVKFKEAVPLFHAVGSHIYECGCLKEIGAASRLHDNDSAYHYLSRALALSTEMGDTARIYENLSLLAGYYYCVEDYAKCKDLSVEVLTKGQGWLRANILSSTYTNAAFAYAKLGMADSALFYDQAKPPSPQQGLDKMNHHRTLSLIAQSRGDAEGYIKHNLAEDEIADSILLASMQAKIREVEAKYDVSQAELETSRVRLKLILSLLALGLMAISIGILIYRQRRRAKTLALEMEALRDELSHSVTEVQTAHRANDELRGAVKSHLATMSDYLETYYTFSHNPKQFAAHFKAQVNTFANDEDFWTKMKAYLDETHDGLISRLTEQYPDLSDMDVKFICLDCCDFPTGVTMLLMGFTNRNSVINRRYLIAKRMGGAKIKDLITA